MARELKRESKPERELKRAREKELKRERKIMKERESTRLIIKVTSLDLKVFLYLSLRRVKLFL